MKDLLKLYSFESVHGTEDEKAIADWICQWLDANNIKDYQRLGNSIYRLSKESPILSAHLDQVKTNGKAVKFFINNDEKIIAFNNKFERTSLGADDKNGVWIILQALKAYPNDLNFIISEGEETGCIGITALEQAGVLDAISESNFCIVLDRRGGSDMLKGGSCATYCSTLAQSLCNFLGNTYTVTTGSVSDTQTLCKHCESVNMSVAYDNPHQAKEMTDFKRLKEICADVLDVLDGFEHYSTPVSIYSTSTTSTYKYLKSDWSKYYD